MEPDDRGRSTTWTELVTSAVRAGFGLVWVINAYLTWRPEFASHYVGYLRNAATGQPRWLVPWFDAWIRLVEPNVGLFVALTRVVESVIALSLLLGLARKPIYVLGALFSLLIWATAEGFGGPYTTGASNLGPALAYVMVFTALIVMERLQGLSPYSLDFYIERRFVGWRRVAEPARRERLEPVPKPIGWRLQTAAIASLAFMLVFLFGTLHSVLHAKPATPKNAAAAVSPLALAGPEVKGEVRSAALPPLLGPGERVKLDIEAKDVVVPIASGVTYSAWTFGGTVPAPVVHVRQGQTLDVTFANNGHMLHSIDFHAAQIAPSVAFESIDPGKTKSFSFQAQTPGAFVFHCGTPPVLQHMANGMYGAIVVDPATPLPPAEREFVIVQSEWYTQVEEGKRMGGDFLKMQAVTPDEVVFNGVAFQYRDHPLQVHSGKRFRMYFANAGPNLPSAFHIIGGIFEKVYPDGNPSHALDGVSTYEVGPGAGVIVDVILRQPGKYPFVDHSMRNMSIGAMGVIEVLP